MFVSSTWSASNENLVNLKSVDPKLKTSSEILSSNAVDLTLTGTGFNSNREYVFVTFSSQDENEYDVGRCAELNETVMETYIQ